MRRRQFVHGIGVATVAILTGVPIVSNASTADRRERYEKLARVEVMVFGAGKRPQKMVFVSGRPQRLPLTDRPVALSLEERGEDTLKMSIYAIESDGSLTLVDYSYPGKNSTQYLGGYDVSLEIATFGRHGSR